MQTLYDYQQQHFERLLSIFARHQVAIDCSITGAGKTIVSIHLAVEMIKRGLKNVIIVCPPTLQAHWTNYLQPTSLTATVVSSHSLQKIRKKLASYEEYFLIVDECHLFKNDIKRTAALKIISKRSRYTLMLSATPYDDNRQFNNIRELFNISADLKDHVSRMDFAYKTRTEFDYYHVYMSQELLSEYNKGYQSISYAVIPQANGQRTFKPKMFTAGIQKIHDTLIMGCTDFLRNQLEENPTHKFVVILNFTRHFEYLTEALEDVTPVLTLNGGTKMDDRPGVIAKFQQDDSEYRVIAISGEVGSVGIELDDKTGNYPRHMICLPMTNAVNFCQAIGRVQRTKTKSHSRVTVIQPSRKVTYFKTQIARKFQVLEQFMSIPEFKEYYEPAPEEPAPEPEDEKMITSSIQ